MIAVFFLLLGISYLCVLIMKKRKNSSLNVCDSEDVVPIADEVKAGVALNVSSKNKPVGKEKKDVNILADLSHKNTSGANNWQTFLKLNQQETKGASKPNLKKMIRPHKPDPLAKNLLSSPKEKSLTNKNRIVNNCGRNNKGDKSLVPDNEVKPMTKVKTGEKIKVKKHDLTKQIAMDCEMVGVEMGVNNSILARVSLVNAHGDCIYDKYVKPTEPVLDYRTQVSGIRPKDLENAHDFKTVQKEVAEILAGRVLVGHALHNDLRVLFLNHPRYALRDTARFPKLRGAGPIPSLKSLANKYLGVTIQDGEHNSVQDALATMQLYKMFKKEWEASFHTRKFTNLKAKTMSVSSSLSMPTAMDI